MRTKVSGGSSGIPGVSGDGVTPGGLIIAGGLTAGDPPTSAVNYHTLEGSTTIQSTQSSVDDQDDVLLAFMGGQLTSDSTAHVILAIRSVAMNGHAFTSPMTFFNDASTSIVPIAVFQKQNVTQFQIDSDGVTIHNKIRTGASVAHSLGSYSGNAVPIYDESGTLLGYMPLYA